MRVERSRHGTVFNFRRFEALVEGGGGGGGHEPYAKLT